MRRLVAVLTVALCMNGCTTYRGSKKAAMAGLWMGGGGLVGFFVFGAIADGTGSSMGTGLRCQGNAVCIVAVVLALTGIIAIPAGAAVSLGGLAGMGLHATSYENEEASRTRAQEQAKARAKAREEAWHRTVRARAAARDGDCSTVAVADREVTDLDADFHATVFVRDVAIKACLDAANAPAIPASP